jgi:hydroxymethylpyrimidine pyrophosphatase-like HAD family hydrolase
MKPLLLFDVDGTIAESGQSIDENILNLPIFILEVSYIK